MITNMKFIMFQVWHNYCCRSIFGNYSNLFLTIMQNYGNLVKYSLKIGNAITWNNRLTEFASIKLNF